MDDAFNKVTHCICTNTSIVSLSKYKDIIEVQKNTLCGSYCGLCIPYISYFLTTYKAKLK